MRKRWNSNPCGPVLPNRASTRTPNGIRTRATAVKGRRPRPLDDGGQRPRTRRTTPCEPLQHRASGGPAPKGGAVPTMSGRWPFFPARHPCGKVSAAWPGSSVGTSDRLKIGRSAVRPRPWPPPGAAGQIHLACGSVHSSGARNGDQPCPWPPGGRGTSTRMNSLSSARPGLRPVFGKLLSQPHHEPGPVDDVDCLDRLAGDPERVAQPDVTGVERRQRHEVGVGDGRQVDDLGLLRNPRASVRRMSTT